MKFSFVSFLSINVFIFKNICYNLNYKNRKTKCHHDYLHIYKKLNITFVKILNIFWTQKLSYFLWNFTCQKKPKKLKNSLLYWNRVTNIKGYFNVIRYVFSWMDLLHLLIRFSMPLNQRIICIFTIL